MEIEGQTIRKLQREFYTNAPVTGVARSLIGKYLVTELNGNATVGRIVETEAYDGRKDKASHAFMKRTKRTEIMYREGGYAYIYLCYGIHHLFNVVTNREGLADAVLVRAIEPSVGIEIMQQRRGQKEYKKLGNGPGILSHSLGLRTNLTGTDLTEDKIWIGEIENGEALEIVTDRRVGVDYAGEDALLPWRYFVDDNKFVSKKKQKDVDSSKFLN